MVSLCTGVASIIIYFILKRFTPDKPNMLVGYKTPMSLKNTDTWNEAQQFSADVSYKLGVVSIVAGLFLAFTNEFKNTVYFWTDVVIGITCTLLIIVLTEIHLKSLFDKSGNRK